MLRGEIDAATAGSAEDLLHAYEAILRETIDRVGAAAIAERSGLARGTIDAIIDEGASDIPLETAAAVLGADSDRPKAETVAAEARDLLLLGMTTAVVDVDTLSSSMSGQMEPKELQQKLEGRHPMTLAEYAAVHYHLGEHVE